MKKIIYMLVLMIVGNICAADHSSDDWSGDASTSSQSGSRTSGEYSGSGDALPADYNPQGYGYGDRFPVDGGADASAEGYAAYDPELVIPVGNLTLSVPASSDYSSMAISDPMPRGMPPMLPPKRTDSSYGRQIAAGMVTLAPIKVISCVNRAHNPATITVPTVHPGMVSIFTVLGTKGQKGTQTKQIGMQIPVLSVNPTTFDADYATKTLWTIIKGHDAERHIIHYSPQGVYSYTLTPEGTFTNRTNLALASDVERELVLVIDHGKLPGIKLIPERDLSAVSKKRGAPKLPSIKHHK